MASGGDDFGGVLLDLMGFGIMLVIGFVAYKWLIGQTGNQPLGKSPMSLNTNGLPGLFGGGGGGGNILGQLQAMLNGTDASLNNLLGANDTSLNGNSGWDISSLPLQDASSIISGGFDPTLSGGGYTGTSDGSSVNILQPTDPNPTDGISSGTGGS